MRHLCEEQGQTSVRNKRERWRKWISETIGTKAMRAVTATTSRTSATSSMRQSASTTAEGRTARAEGESMTEAPAPPKGVERDVPCRSAGEFMAHLTASSDLWDGDVSRWVFRGQANADWSLVPTAIRDPKAFAAFGIEGDASQWHRRAGMMEELLNRFRTDLNRAGMPVPAEMPTGARRNSTHYASDPPRSDFPLMALAQHHGLPTLFLDWTRRARVAAYFAAAPQFGAASANDRPPTAGRLAVWAIHLPPNADAFADDGSSRLLWRYDAPASTNPNLHAQAGLFTILRPVPRALVNPLDPGAPNEVLNATIEEFVHYAATLEPGAYTLRRLTLPNTEAPRLLRLLSHEGVDGAAMFPGTDGVVRGMRERAMWDVPDRGLRL
jgi:hypothetical protein